MRKYFNIYMFLIKVLSIREWDTIVDLFAVERDIWSFINISPKLCKAKDLVEKVCMGSWQWHAS